MSNLCLFKDERIRFSPIIESSSHPPIMQELEDWLTPEGLVLPLTRGALELREVLLDPTYHADLMYEDGIMGLVVRPNGRLVVGEFTRNERNRSLTRPIFMVRPTGKNAKWAMAGSRLAEQSAMVMLEFTEDLSKVIDDLDRIEPMLTGGYEEWDYAKLVEYVAGEVKARFPAKPKSPTRRGIHTSDEGGDSE
jgi:hypothetical protein